MRDPELSQVLDPPDDAVEDVGEPSHPFQRRGAFELIPVAADAPGGFVANGPGRLASGRAAEGILPLEEIMQVDIEPLEQ